MENEARIPRFTEGQFMVTPRGSICAFLFIALAAYGFDSQNVAHCDSTGTAPPSTGGVVTSVPATVSLSIDEELRAQISSALDRGSTVRLRILGVIPPAGSRAVNGLRVFLNKSDANSATSDDDVHYVTAVEFQPGAQLGKAQGFSMNIAGTLARLRDHGDLRFDMPLQVTLVANAAKDVGTAQVAIEVPFEKIEITVPKR